MPPPWLALPTAIAVSATAAMFSFPYRYYRCWKGWGGLQTIIWIVGYFLIAGGTGGALGWLVGWGTKFQPTQSEALNGIFYGAAGALAIGGQWRSKPKKGADNLGDVRSLLIKWVEQIEGNLDDLARDAAAKWLRSKKRDELIVAAWQIEAHITNGPSQKLTDRAKKALLGPLVENMEAVASSVGDNMSRGRAREQLIDFCSRYYIIDHIVKPGSLTVAEDGSVTETIVPAT